MTGSVVITGIGIVTPLGKNPKEVLRRIEARETAAAPPTHFDVSPFACPVCAQVTEFRPQDYVAEPKMVRLMNRDAQLAVAAAHLALQDARLKVGVDYPSDDVALYGATGLAGLSLGEVAPLIRNSVGPDGSFDPVRFGQQGLKSISPLLSFKVLGNMPVCFVSICENLQGPNCIYTPWEGQGAQAIEAGMRAIQRGKARCAVVGGCDVKTHELAFIALEQRGLFQSWRDSNQGMVPGEGAVFLVLEAEENAVARRARCYARVVGCGFATQGAEADRANAFSQVMTRLLGRLCPPFHEPPGGSSRRKEAQTSRPEKNQSLVTSAATVQGFKARNLVSGNSLPKGEGVGEGSIRLQLDAIVAAGDDDPATGRDEAQALSAMGISALTTLHPKHHAGNLFAAAAALQVAVGALLSEQFGGRVLANCFGHGSEQAAFLLERP